MAISANYQQPVVVNGYPCWNCHQVSEAKKGVDPATQGPFGAQSPTAAGNAAAGTGTTAQAGSTTGVIQTSRVNSTARLDIFV